MCTLISYYSYKSLLKQMQWQMSVLKPLYNTKIKNESHPKFDILYYNKSQNHFWTSAKLLKKKKVITSPYRKLNLYAIFSFLITLIHLEKQQAFESYPIWGHEIHFDLIPCKTTQRSDPIPSNPTTQINSWSYLITSIQFSDLIQLLKSTLDLI